MADRGAGEGSHDSFSMPSAIGGRGRGRARGPGVASPSSGGSAVAQQPLPAPGVPSSPNVPTLLGGDARSPGRKGEGGLRKPKPETQVRLLGGHGPGGDAPSMQQQQEQFTNNNVKVPNQAGPSKASSDLNVNAPAFVSKSTLSVAAKEFVPRIFSQPQSQSTPQRPAAPVPHAAAPGSRLDFISSWDSVPSVLTTPTNNYAVDRVKQTVFRLTIAPGNLEEFVIPLVEDLNATTVDFKTVIDIINVIFEQAVSESNFTYTGARMCDWFCRNFKPFSVGEPIKFLNVLMKRCQVEQENSSKLATGNPSRLQGFALFMAELLQNVKFVTPTGEVRIDILGKKLKELVMILLQHPLDSNLKCVVRILKCTGADLEDTERMKTGHTVEMDSLIAQCLTTALSSSLNIPDSVRNMLKSVGDLRATNWGRFGMEVTQGSEVVQEPRAPSPFTQSEPVFFNQYGHMITREEAGFAEESDYSYSSDGYQEAYVQQEPQFNDNSSFDDNGYTDLEIDDEIADAFEQFLIETQQA